MRSLPHRKLEVSGALECSRLSAMLTLLCVEAFDTNERHFVERPCFALFGLHQFRTHLEVSRSKVGGIRMVSMLKVTCVFGYAVNGIHKVLTGMDATIW